MIDARPAPFLSMLRPPVRLVVKSAGGAGHDVSGEARDAGGRWTAGSGASAEHHQPLKKPHEYTPDEYRKLIAREFVKRVDAGQSGYKPGSVKLSDGGELLVYRGRKYGWVKPASFEPVWIQASHDVGAPHINQQQMDHESKTEIGRESARKRQEERDAKEAEHQASIDERMDSFERATSEPHTMTKAEYEKVTLPLPDPVRINDNVRLTKSQAQKYLDENASPDVDHVVMMDYDHRGRKTGGYNIHERPTHRKLVADAIAGGKKVPPEVLADYPDLTHAKSLSLPWLTKQFEEGKHPRNHGQFSRTPGGAGAGRGETASRRSGDRKPGPEYDRKPADLSGNPTKTARSLLGRLSSVPAKMRSGTIAFVHGKYKQLEEKYGRKGAIAIIGASVLLAAAPVPFSSLIPIALAEAFLVVKRAVAGKGLDAGLDAETVEHEARALLKGLWAHHGETWEDDGDVEAKPARKAFVWPWERPLPWVVKSHDVSGEPRDDRGRWTAGGNSTAERLASAMRHTQSPDELRSADGDRSVERIAHHHGIADHAVRELAGLSQPQLYALLSKAGLEGVKPRESKRALLQRLHNRLTAAVRARERAEV